MIKLQFLPTGNIFILPDNTALELLSQFPSDYAAVETQKTKPSKAGKTTKISKYDNKKKSKNKNSNSINSSILSLIIDI